MTGPLPGASTAESALVVGVDGGGTKTVAWLARHGDTGAGTPLAVGEAGPGNPRAAGFEVAQGNIEAAVKRAFAASGLPPQPVRAACFGLSGAGREEEQNRIRDWALSRQLARQVRVTHDAETILAAGDEHGTGIALIAGTGSLAWGRDASGRYDRTGGWGYLLGDEGSGYWIALAALRAAVRSADGRGQPTNLLGRLLETFALREPQELIAAVYSADMTRERIAQLAPIVFELWSMDGVAAEIAHAAAEELAGMTATLARKLGLSAGNYTLAVTGSVLVHQPAMRLLLEESLREQGASPGSMPVVTQPVAGAVRLARRLAAAR